MPYAVNPEDGVRIYYQVEGEGLPLVLHHGGNGSLDRWYEVGWVEALREEHRLILLDARGHGRSDRPDDYRAYFYRSWVADILAILDDLGIERVHYLGYSLGGLIGFRLALNAPERLWSTAIGGAHPFALYDFFNQQYEEMRDDMGVAFERREREGSPLSAEQRSEILRASNHRVATAVGRALRDESGLDERLSEMTVPALLFAGSEDTTGGVDQRLPEAARLMPGATYLMFGGLGHRTVLVQRDRVLPHLRAFLGSLSPGD